MGVWTSLVGITVLLGLALLLSDNRKAIKPRTVIGAFSIQAGLAAFVLYIPVGKDVLQVVSDGVQSVINSAQAGISFLFGALVSDKMFEVFGGGGFIFALKVLPIIVFFSSLISVLYYLGIMQWIIKLIGGALHKSLGISRPESMSATANIFVGPTEAPLVVRPFIPKMTQSELFAVMTGGLASVAGSVLAGYAGLGIELKYLIAASFMAAPGGLLMAKIIKPEVDRYHDDVDKVLATESRPANIIDAAATGASSGLQLAFNVGAMLLAFIGLIALLNTIVGAIGTSFGEENLTIQLILGYIFAPLAWLIGVPWAEALQAGSFIGEKLVLNEFVAYIDFVGVKESLSSQTQVIVTFALCGFANLASLAVLLGGLGTMAPDRRSDIAKMSLKAVAAGSLANLMSAALAGVFFAL